jgi:hypothetical protein
MNLAPTSRSAVRDESPTVSVDLLRASYRSDAFPQDWSAEERQRAFSRYRKWLGLKQRHPQARLTPTRDIDLFWRLHMLSPVSYTRDCVRIFGYVLDHDTGCSEAEVSLRRSVLAQTAARWEAEYREPYRQ